MRDARYSAALRGLSWGTDTRARCACTSAALPKVVPNTSLTVSRLMGIGAVLAPGRTALTLCL